MAELDTGSILLIALAVPIAPVVLPALIRWMRGAAGPVSRWFE